MFSLKRIAPKIWHLHFKTQYEMTMHIFRFDNYLEDKYNPKKFFTIAELKKQYKKYSNKKTFTYPKDWTGIHTSNDLFERFLENPKKAFPDKNARDELMIGIIKTIISIDGKIFSLISTFGKHSNREYKHEIAHALYYLNKNYRKKIKKIISKIDKQKLDKLCKILIKHSRSQNAKDALDDEIQAYTATGIWRKMKKFISKKIRRKFVATFKQYYKGSLKK